MFGEFSSISHLTDLAVHCLCSKWMVQNLHMTEVSPPFQRGPFSWASGLKKAAGAWVVKGQAALGEMPVSLVQLQPLFPSCRLNCHELWCNWVKIKHIAASQQLWKETYHNCIFKVFISKIYCKKGGFATVWHCIVNIWQNKAQFLNTTKYCREIQLFPPRISQKTSYTSVHVIFFR